MGARRPTARERANRLNSKKSTGPKTQAGKRRSSRNATLHGLRAEARRELPNDVAHLVPQFAGEGASQETLRLAEDLLQAQSSVTVARQLRSRLIRLVTQNLRDEDGSDLARDPLLKSLVSEEGRRAVASLGVEARADMRMILAAARLEEKARKRKEEPLKVLRRVERYEQHALRLRRRAAAQLDALRDAEREAKNSHASSGVPNEANVA